MGLHDGPLIVGWDFVAGTGDIWQIVSDVTSKVHTETPIGGHTIKFFDGVYWPEDGLVYIVGQDAQTINGQQIHGKIWTWNGTTLTVDRTFEATGSSRFHATTIVVFGGDLYVGIANMPDGNAAGFKVFRKTATKDWTQVFASTSSSFEGIRVLREDNSQLLALPAKKSGSGANPAGYYYSSDGTSWNAGDAVDGDLDPTFLFWDSGNSKWRWGGDSGPPATIHQYTASTLDGAWVNTNEDLGEEVGAGEIGIGDGVWYTQLAATSASSKWDGSTWSTWFDLLGVVTIGYNVARATPRYTLGSWYTPVVDFNAAQGSYYKDTTRYLYGGSWSAGSAVIPTELPDTWDIVQIEPRKWGSGPFCDETESGTTVFDGSHLEIDGTQGLSTPSYYDLQFGSTCSAVPTDWDMQIEVELTKLPALHDVNGARLVFWAYNPATERKVAVALSKQGIAVYGLDTYAELIPNSAIFAEGDTVTLKLTVLSSDTDHQRAYLSLIKDGAALRVGFGSYEKADGATGRIHVEAVGTPETPVQVNLAAVRLRDHDFDPGTDPDSIDDTKPVAGIA